MIFLDTCIWIELVAAKTPVTPNEIRQASLAGKLLQMVRDQKETIITCRKLGPHKHVHILA